jgi:hypothetical protein
MTRPSKQKIAKLLERSQVAWILKEEDRKLARGKRDDPAKAYSRAGIKFVD